MKQEVKVCSMPSTYFRKQSKSENCYEWDLKVPIHSVGGCFIIMAWTNRLRLLQEKKKQDAENNKITHTNN